jgi:dephospho-CoA kinase
MSFRLGLTGSIGMGKSTTAAMFAEAGVPVWDADAAVHRLYQPGQPAAIAVKGAFPEAMDPDGGVNRTRLRAMLRQDRSLIDRLNALVHPLVAQDRSRFLTEHSGSPVVLLDIPLLFETGARDQCDAVAVVTAPAKVQRERVLQRGMSEAEFEMILAHQMPDADKRDRADYIIPTTSLDVARAAVKDILADISRRIDRHA